MRFAVIGHPVGHSLSPELHTSNFRALGLDAVYEAIDVDPSRLAVEFARFVAEGFVGINVTVPHKLAVMPLVTHLDESARLAGAVNTVRFEADGSSVGFNTDMDGFIDSVRSAGFDPGGLRVCILGSGGAARAVAAGCLRAGAEQVTILNRTLARAQELAATLSVSFPRADIDTGVLEPGRLASVGAQLVVNCTTVGLKADDPPVLPLADLASCRALCDIIPVRRETATLAAARSAGVAAIGGLGMLVAQAARAFRIWTGLEFRGGV